MREKLDKFKKLRDDFRKKHRERRERNWELEKKIRKLGEEIDRPDKPGA